MAQRAGTRTERVTFETAVRAPDDYGQEVETWTPAASALATIFWGAGSERRQAAQEGGHQAASFVVLSTTATRAIGIRSRLRHAGAVWDIQSIVLRGRTEIEFNAVRAL